MKDNFFRFLAFKRKQDPQARRRAEWMEALALCDRALDADRRARQLLLRHGPELLKRRREGERALQMEQADRAILRAFRGEGGIAFHGRQLLRYVNYILPEETDLHAMWVGGYSSAMEPMVLRLKALEKRLEAPHGEETEPMDEAHLLQALHYQDLKEQKQALYRMMPGPARTEDPAQFQAAVERLDFLARQNLAVAREVEEGCQSPRPEPYKMQNQRLLEGMRYFLSEDMTGGFRREAGWTAEDYRRALTRYARQLTEELLIPFGGMEDPF